MLRVLIVAMVVALGSFVSGESVAQTATGSRGASRATGASPQSVAYRYRSYRSSTGRRPGTGYTPWYLLPKTDPRRFNGPHYYWK